MERIFKVQLEADLENQALARAVAAAYAAELDPTVEELRLFRRHSAMRQYTDIPTAPSRKVW